MLVQAALGTLCIALFAVISAAQASASACALVTVLLPSASHAWLQGQTRNATRLLLLGVLRMLFTVALMAVSLAGFAAHPLGFFVSFAVMQLAYVAGLRLSRTAAQVVDSEDGKEDGKEDGR